MKIGHVILVTLLVGVCCFFLGRHTLREETVRYVSGETVSGSFNIPKLNINLDSLGGLAVSRLFYRPYSVVRYDTVVETQIAYVVDTLHTYEATVEDWNRRREYRQTLFDDLNGKLEVDFLIQFNELQRLSYSFRPVYKETITRKDKVFVPFLTASYSSLTNFGIGAGMFYHNIGFSVKFLSGEKRGVETGVMWKF